MEQQNEKEIEGIENELENEDEEQVEIVETKQSLFERVSKLVDIEGKLKEVADYSAQLLEVKGKVAYEEFIGSEEYAELLNQMLEIKDKAEREVKDKVNSYVWILKKIEKEQELYDAREKYFGRKSKALKNQIENLKYNLRYNLTREGIEKLDTLDFGISINESESTEILDKKQIPQDLCTIKYDPSKTKIKKFLLEKGVRELKGAQNKVVAELRINKNIQIK